MNPNTLIYTRMRVNTHTDRHTHVHTYTHTHTHTHRHTHTHTHTHTHGIRHTHTHTHTRMNTIRQFISLSFYIDCYIPTDNMYVKCILEMMAYLSEYISRISHTDPYFLFHHSHVSCTYISAFHECRLCSVHIIRTNVILWLADI